MWAVGLSGDDCPVFVNRRVAGHASRSCAPARLEPSKSAATSAVIVASVDHARAVMPGLLMRLSSGSCVRRYGCSTARGHELGTHRAGARLLQVVALQPLMISISRRRV